MATDIGIDLGTSKTVIFSSSKVVLELPSFVTVDNETWLPVYFGEKAKETLGRTPDSLTCVSPIQNGIISDYEIAEAMLKNYMQQAFGNKIIRPRIMATLPAGLTELQHHSLANVIEAAGGRNVSVIEGPLAVAYGLEINMQDPRGVMVVDVGAGTTDIAVISLGGIAVYDSCKTASNDFDSQIMRYVRKEYNLEIGPLTAESVKKQIASLIPRNVEVAMVVKGRNVFTGLPESIELSSAEVYDAIIETGNAIFTSIKNVFSKTDPDLVSDIKNDGIYLTGGGALLSGFAEFLSEKLQVDVKLLDDPSHSVVRGAAYALKYSEILKNVDYQVRSIKELAIE